MIYILYLNLCKYLGNITVIFNFDAGDKEKKKLNLNS